MPISPRASEIGLPALRASSRASVLDAAPRARRRAGAGASARSPGATARQAGKGLLARARPRRRSPRRRPAEPPPSPPRWRARRPAIIDRRLLRRARAPRPPASPITRLALVLLRVPEHAEREERVGQLDRLDQRRRRRPPVTTRPSPSSSIPWWWCDFTAVVSRAHHPRGERARLRGAPRGR